jgi:hypothetical protein
LGSQRNEGSSEVTPNAGKLWDPDTEAFNLDGKPLRIEVEDIYFITGLSRRGEVVNLKARGAGSGMNIEDYIATHCVAGTEKVGSQLPIRAINNLSFKIIVLVYLHGSQGQPHCTRHQGHLCSTQWSACDPWFMTGAPHYWLT